MTVPSNDLEAGATLDELLQLEASEITTVIDVGVVFEGNLKLSSGRAVLVSGKVIGTIESAGAVIVNAGGEIVGSIKARCAQIAGTVSRGGDNDCMDIQGVLVLAKTAKVNCNAVYGDMKWEYGAKVTGDLSPREDVDETKAVVSLHRVSGVASAPSSMASAQS